MHQWLAAAVLFAMVTCGSSAVTTVSTISHLAELRAAHRYVALQLCAVPDSGWPLPDLAYQDHVAEHDMRGWTPPTGNDPCVILGTVFNEIATSWTADKRGTHEEVLFVRALIGPNDWEFMAAVGATGIPGLIWFDAGSELPEDMGRSFYLRVGYPIHFIHPLELDGAFSQLVRPVGQAMGSADELTQWISAADEHDGELGAVMLVLRWPAVGEPGLEELSKFLKQWHSIFQVAVAQPTVFREATKAKQGTAAVIFRADGTRLGAKVGLAALPQWLRQKALPIAGAFSSSSYLPLVKALPLKPLLLLFVNDSQPEFQQLVTDFAAVARQLESRFNSVVVKSSEMLLLDSLQRAFGLAENTDGLAILQAGEANKYSTATDVMPAAQMVKWSEDVLAGRVSRAVMSSGGRDDTWKPDSSWKTSKLESLNSWQLRQLLHGPLDYRLLIYLCTSTNTLCQKTADTFAQISSEMLSLQQEPLRIYTFDPSKDDLPVMFNASGVRVWGNNNIPPELAALPIIGYHYIRYFNVPAIYMLAPGSQQFVRFEGALNLDQMAAFVSESTGDSEKTEL